MPAVLFLSASSPPVIFQGSLKISTIIYYYTVRMVI